jgi:alginate O-acetyltransferase complex protein AlgI
MSRLTRDLEEMTLGGRPAWIGWMPMALLPAIVLGAGFHEPNWVFMWCLALSLWAGAKWLTFWNAEMEKGVSRVRIWEYFCAWPGMNPQEFLKPARFCETIPSKAWASATTKTVAGILIIWVAVRYIPATFWLIQGWVALIGLVLLLHFGLFQLVALLWRRAGVDARPIMREPVLAKSLSEFWGCRWNVAFHQLVHQNLYVPLRRMLGAIEACFAAFVFSGVIHDLVISVPARGGYGLPLTYFLIQGCGVVFERSVAGRRLGLRGGWRGKIFALAIVVGPLFCLFHPPFIQHVILPMLAAIGAT